MRYVVSPGWSSGTCFGGGMFVASAHRTDRRPLTLESTRKLDLSRFLSDRNLEWCRRTANRWALSNGFIRKYRPKAADRRALRRIRGGGR